MVVAQVKLVQRGELSQLFRHDTYTKKRGPQLEEELLRQYIVAKTGPHEKSFRGCWRVCHIAALLVEEVVGPDV